MKNLFFLMTIILLSSCDPDVPGEGINLPIIDFKLSIIKDTSHFKIGDTLTIKSKTSTTLKNGVKIKDGKLRINCAMSFTKDSAFLNEANISGPIIGEDLLFISSLGEIDISPSGDIRQIISYPKNDLFEFELKIVLLKKGAYSFSVYTNFFEGTQGKTRANPFFDIVNNNSEELWQVPGMPATTPSDPTYKSKYLFAVTE